jgi:Tfp pilus assembly protein PilF
MGKISKTENMIRKVTIIDPENAKANAILGKIFLSRGQKTEAAKYFKKASTCQGSNADAEYYMGLHFLENKDKVEAFASFKRCIRLDKNHFGASMNLATILAN